MSLVLIYPVFFLIIFLRIKQKKNHLFYSGLIFVYLFASICSYFDMQGLNRGAYLDLTAILFHCLCLFLILRRFNKFDKFRNIEIIKLDNATLYTLTGFFILCGTVAIIEGLPQVSLYSIVNETQDLRLLMESEGFGQRFYLTYFGVKYWTIPLVLAFYYIRYKPEKKILILLLFIVSFAYVIDGLKVAGRECLLKYSFVFFVFFLFFKDTLGGEWKKRLKLTMIVGASLIVGFFAIITFMRFDVSKVQQSINVNSSLITYAGQGFVNFSSVFYHFPKGLSHGSSHFPFFFPNAVRTADMSGLRLNTFSTSIGTWVKEFGIFGAFILTLIYSLLLKVVTSIKCNIFTLFYVAWALEFVFSMLFFYNEVLNGSRVISLATIILFDVLLRNYKK